MGAVRGRGNKTTERRMRLALVRAGISGWKLHTRGIPGNPDFFFPDSNLVVFVDGCFWHGCPVCGHYPKTRAAFWKAKIDRNRERDEQTTARLCESGHIVVRFWEHELQQDMTSCLQRVSRVLEDNRQSRTSPCFTKAAL